MRFDYIRDPAEIVARSFAQVSDADLAHVPEDLRGVARRLVHARGDPSILAGLRASPGAGAVGAAALAGGATVLTDAAMVAAGIARARLPDSRVLCTLNLGGVAARAKRHGITRSAAAVELWRPWLGGAVVAIGNAPTALFRLLEGLIDEDWPRPALIVGMPVGFVGAAEAKDALAEHATIPYVTLTGADGGSALAAAAINAFAGEPA